MSRHNRERRKWKCAKCGARMWAELKGPSEREMARIAESRPVDPRIAHICGGCRSFHYEDGDALRLLTPAEMFELNFQTPDTMAHVERMFIPRSDGPAGTLIIAQS